MPLTNVIRYHTLGILGMDLASVHGPGQYNKACFNMAQKTVVVVLFSPGGINTCRFRIYIFNQQVFFL